MQNCAPSNGQACFLVTEQAAQNDRPWPELLQLTINVLEQCRSTYASYLPTGTPRAPDTGKLTELASAASSRPGQDDHPRQDGQKIERDEHLEQIDGTVSEIKTYVNKRTGLMVKMLKKEE